MDKKFLINQMTEFYKKFNVNPTDCYVTHGGAMVLLGLNPTTSDIDLTVTKEVYDRFKNELGFEPIFLEPCGTLPEAETLQVSDYIFLQAETAEQINYDTLFSENDVQFRNMKATYEDYSVLGRMKDLLNLRKLGKLITPVDRERTNFDEAQLRRAMDNNYHSGSLAGNTDKPYEPPSFMILGKPKK